MGSTLPNIWEIGEGPKFAIHLASVEFVWNKLFSPQTNIICSICRGTAFNSLLSHGGILAFHPQKQLVPALLVLCFYQCCIINVTNLRIHCSQIYKIYKCKKGSIECWHNLFHGSVALADFSEWTDSNTMCMASNWAEVIRVKIGGNHAASSSFSHEVGSLEDPVSK